jgi:hypothetical protein
VAGECGGGAAFPIRRVILRWCLGVNSVSLAQNTPALRPAGVSGGKEAWMVMEVDDSCGWGVWGGAAFPIRRVILRWCLG